MPTVSVALDLTQYVQVNVGLNPMVLQCNRDSVRIVLSELKPTKSNAVFHSLGGEDAPLQLHSIDTNVWALGLTETSSLIVSETNEIPVSSGKVSLSNNHSTLIVASGSFTGEWEDVAKYDSLVVAVKTDQNGEFEIQFSPDGVNQDSTLTRYYHTTHIEAPQRFTITRQYFRILFTNTSVTDQTYFRLQCLLGDRGNLNSPTDSKLPQDFDATLVRPTDFKYEVALGRRQGYTTWNKFGHNDDIDVGTETVWSNGGIFARIDVASTFTIACSDAADTATTGTGAWNVVIDYIDENRFAQSLVVPLNGLTDVVTTITGLGINRAAIYNSGSADSNVGSITITETTGGTVQALIEPGTGVTHQCIYFTQTGHTLLVDWMHINVNKIASGGSPTVQIEGWVYSYVSDAKYLVYFDTIDAATTNIISLVPSQPFVIGEQSIFWLDATTDKADTVVSARFSGIESRGNNVP